MEIEMEQEREAPQKKQQEERPSQTPLQCPRCGSTDTKFRYYNNNSRAQPRHYCKTCKRLWTVGGNVRNIPVGGKIKDCKTYKASPSKGGNSTSEPLNPLLPQQKNSQSKTPMPSIGSQNVDTTIFQQFSNFPSPLSPFAQYCSNDEISCLDAIQSLIQPEITNRHVYHGNHFINVNVGVNEKVPQEWNVQNMASQQTMQQELPGNMESHQPARPMNSLPRETTDGLSFTTSNEGIDINNDTTNTKDPNYVNVDEWLNFPGDDAP